MNNTKHNNNCTRVFKNYDMTCPRCLELSQGATAREGWQTKYFTNKAHNEMINNKYNSSQLCSHPTYNLNAGGYCNLCGKGRDFS